jgi:glycosyltransferase involved in cell wall biosynthesis
MSITISVVIPTLNEERTIGICIQKAIAECQRLKHKYEIIICDSYSKDATVKIAQQLGARIIYQPLRGYGNAYLKGISEAKGSLIIIGDADNTYDFSDIEKFITPLLGNECDLVIGNRLNKTMKKGAMPWAHRYIGTPIMTWTINALFQTKIKDCNCGMRSFTKEIYNKMNLQSPGWELSAEMIIQASRLKARIHNVEITLHKGAIGRQPHLNPWEAAFTNFKLIIKLFLKTKI